MGRSMRTAMNSAGSLDNVECISVEKRLHPHKHHVFVLLTTWSNGLKHPIYRKYSCFFDFQDLLKEQFQEIYSDIPELPALSLFDRGLASKEALLEKKKKIIEEFCQKIIQLPSELSQSNSVVSFFEAWSSDFIPQDRDRASSVGNDVANKRAAVRRKKNAKEKNKERPNSDPPAFSLLNALDSQISGKNDKLGNTTGHTQMDTRNGSVDHNHVTDQHVVVAEYKKRRRGEVNLHEGDVVDVLEKNLSGWWFVCKESTKEQGWAPGAFLESLVHRGETDDQKFDQNPPVGRCVTLCDYKAQGPDELTYRKGEEVEVIATSLDGWWKVRESASDLQTSQDDSGPEVHSVQYTEVVFDDNGKKFKSRPIIRADSSVAYSEIIPRPVPPAEKTKKEDKKCTKRPPAKLPLQTTYENTEIEQLGHGVLSPSKTPERPTTPGHSYENVSPPVGGVGSNTISYEIKEKDRTLYRVSEDYYGDYKDSMVSCTSKICVRQGDIVEVEKEDGKMSYCYLCNSNNTKVKRGWIPTKLLIKFHQGNKASIPSINVGRHDKSPPIRRQDAVIVTRGVHDTSPRIVKNASVDPPGSEKVKAMLPPRPSSIEGDRSPRSSPNTSPRLSPTFPKPVPRPRNVVLSPSNDRPTVELMPEWDHGKISRHDCESVLLHHGIQCDFLVRESLNRVGDFTISIRYDDRVRHFPIETTSSGKYFIGKHNFKDLSSVVKYYQKHPLFFNDAREAVSLGKALSIPT